MTTAHKLATEREMWDMTEAVIADERKAQGKVGGVGPVSMVEEVSVSSSWP